MIKPVAMVATGGLLVAAAAVGTRAAGGLELEFRPLLDIPSDVLGIVLPAMTSRSSSWLRPSCACRC